MSISIFILWIASIPLSLIHADDIPAPRGFLVSCGSTESINISGLKYIPDLSFTSVGNATVKNNTNQLFPILSNLRFFPDKSARKFCYTFQVIQGAKYLVRTTYFYGNFDGKQDPPVFDQIIDGTRWSVVNTTDEYSKGLASYYELVVAAHGKVLSVCLARNEYTKGASSPYISAIEVMFLDDILYKSVDFHKYALSTVARHTFGKDNKDNGEANFISQALSSAITTSRGKTLEIKWPPTPLSDSNYHISLYFQDNRTPSPYSWRVFNILINGDAFYNKINVTTSGVNVYTPEWPLSGQTQITMIPEDGGPVGPLLNAAEMFQLLPLGGRTSDKDVIAMTDLDRSLNNPPGDWNGDPCLPRKNSWSGVTCSQSNGIARVEAMNLTGLGLSGSLSTSIKDLTAVAHLWLGHNKLSGTLPNMSSMKMLETLHLDNNQFEGSIPESLAKLPREIYLQNNKFKGGIPNSLKNRQGLTIRECLVTGYSDSDYAADVDTRRSVTGYVFTLGGSVVTRTS
uniref:Malectin-like domain-containing protein n=1 Tax=Chenopodium quinoa TaxID=63459 RepID=A0A803LNT2_CHEQI